MGLLRKIISKGVYICVSQDLSAAISKLNISRENFRLKPVLSTQEKLKKKKSEAE